MDADSPGVSIAEQHARPLRMHVVLMFAHTAFFLLVQLLIHLRVFYMVFTLLLTTGFTGVTAAAFIVIAASNRDHTDTFRIGYNQARTVVWTCAVVMLLLLVDVARLIMLMTVTGFTPAESADLGAAVAGLHANHTGLTTAGIESLLVHHIHDSEWVVLLLVALLCAGLFFLHLTSLIIYARVMIAQAPVDAAAASTVAMPPQAPPQYGYYDAPGPDHFLSPPMPPRNTNTRLSRNTNIGAWSPPAGPAPSTHQRTVFVPGRGYVNV